MAWRHKDILEAELHEAKGFTTANNGDSLWRNENGNSEWIDREVLPSALNFVDGSSAPPTTSTGDIYVLSTITTTLDPLWGVSPILNDWVRYDGTEWQLITPSKSILCYDKTLDVLKVYDGSTWNIVGTDTNIGNSTVTFNADHYADLNSFSWTLGGTAPINNEKISFQNNTLVKGSDESVSTNGFEFVNGSDTTLLEIKNNGQIGYGGVYDSSTAHTFRNPNGESYISRFINSTGATTARISNAGSLETWSEDGANRMLNVYRQSGNTRFQLYDASTMFVQLKDGSGSYINTGGLVVGDTSNSNSKAVIELKGNSGVSSLATKFFSNITVTTAQRTGSTLTATEKGYECFDTDLNKKFVWNGSSWEQITSV
tara:strand:- start:758 stop:1873 length:1116 start_codon:yes stop_codon:yes gene_type:complete